MLRIYDKVLELRKTRNMLKQDLLERYRWGGPQERAARVEYQLRREALKQMGVNSVGDYMRLRRNVLHYLTSDWFRLVAEVPDQENHNVARTETHPLWVRVCEAFHNWAGQTTAGVRRTSRFTEIDPVRLLKQGRGCCLRSVAALVGGKALKTPELMDKIQTCFDFLRTQEGDIHFEDLYAAKAIEFAVKKSPGDEDSSVDETVVPWVSDIGDAGVFKRAGIFGEVREISEEQRGKDNE